MFILWLFFSRMCPFLATVPSCDFIGRGGYMLIALTSQFVGAMHFLTWYMCVDIGVGGLGGNRVCIMYYICSKWHINFGENIFNIEWFRMDYIRCKWYINFGKQIFKIWSFIMYYIRSKYLFQNTFVPKMGIIQRIAM